MLAECNLPQQLHPGLQYHNFSQADITNALASSFSFVYSLNNHFPILKFIKDTTEILQILFPSRVLEQYFAPLGMGESCCNVASVHYSIHNRMLSHIICTGK
jgi:hypothetical protein